MRWLLVLLCLAVAGFCAFGYLATFEYPDGEFLLLRTVYAIVGVGALLLGLRLARRRPRG